MGKRNKQKQNQQKKNGQKKKRVQIKEELKKGLILGLKARLPIGIISKFVGHRHKVMTLMQTLSHTTRAYITNAEGLPGFLVPIDIIKLLNDADKVGQLEHVKKWRVIDMSLIQPMLKNFSSSK